MPIRALKTRPAAETAKPSKLLIFDTHPIQYRSPVFSEIAKQLDHFKVVYFNNTFNGKKWWFHEVGKIPPQNWELSLKTGFENVVLETNQLPPWSVYKKIRSLLLREKPAAILLYGYYLPEHWILNHLATKLRIPLIFIGETFTDGSSALRRMLKGPMLHYFFKGVNQFVAIGDKTHAYYRHWDISREKITLAKYCVDTQFFSLSTEDALATKKKIRSQLGIPEDAFVLLFVGRLFERKRPADVVALHRWYRDNPKFHTIIVGNGPMEEELKQIATGIDRIHFVGFKNQGETRDMYHAASLLYVPSEYETWGLVINEAFAAGIPALVTTTCGASGDLVLHGDTGFSYPAGNVPRAISFVERLLKEPHLLARMGLNAKAKVLNEYTPEIFAQSIIRAFKHCLR